MQCLSCSEVIDDDSCYCDMCGTELRICPKHNTPVAGKRCTQCGEPWILASSRSAAQGGRAASDAASAHLGQTSSAAPAPAAISGTRRLSDSESSRGAAPRLRLRNRNLG